METINITSGIDDSYSQHIAVTLVSLFLTNKPYHFHIYLLTLNVTEKHKKQLYDLAQSFSHEITFIPISERDISNFPHKKTDYLSIATYLRLFIPVKLPLDILKVLYIDSDIIFNSNIEELYSIDLNKYSAAAVEDAPNQNPLRLGYDNKDKYFNAGVLLLNLEYLRKIDFTNLALSYIQRNSEIITFHDQDVLNALLHGTVLFLPIKWNMLDCFYFRKPRIYPNYLPELYQSQKAPCIIHFSGPIKPWHWGKSHPLKTLYKHYLNYIPWRKKKFFDFSGIKKLNFSLKILMLLGFSWEQSNIIRKTLQNIKKRIFNQI